MSLSALASVFLLPPVNLAGVALIACLWWRRRAARIVVAGCLAALLLLAMPAVATPLLASLEAGPALHDPGRGAAQAIVVLGADIAVGTDAAGERSILPGALTLQRLQWAAALARRTHLPVLVSGGIVEPGEPAVAVVMARSLKDDFGVPVRWIEPRSADTWENADDSAALLRHDGISTVLIVTHAWHMRRALIACRAAGLVGIPAIAQFDRVGSLRPMAFVPRATDWQRSYYAGHEWIGCLWYWLRARHHGGAA